MGAITALAVMPPLAVSSAIARPDLVVSAGSATLTAGRLVGSFTVRNSGSALAPKSQADVTLTRSGSTVRLPLKTFAIPSLARGTKKTVPLSLAKPAWLAAGTYAVRVCADARSTVRESLEGNNCRALGTVTWSAAVPRVNLCGQLATDRVIGPEKALVYVVTCDVTVSEMLTIEPGTIVKVAAGFGIDVFGSLLSAGTTAKPVTITSLTDDTVGGDTNGDGSGSTAEPGYWGGLDVSGDGYAGLVHSVVRNGTDALVIQGDAYLNDVELAHNLGTGLTVDGVSVRVKDPDIHHNGGDGVVIRRAENALLTAARPTLTSLGRIHDNGGNGLAIGDPDGGTDVNVLVGDLDVYANGEKGILVQHQGAGSDHNGSGTIDARFLDNDIHTNAGNGFWIGRSTTDFAQNKVHNNNQNQWVFDGGGGAGWEFSVNSPSNQNDAGSNLVYCYTARNVFGIFAQGTSTVTVLHTGFEGGGTGLKDFSAQAGSSINVSQNATAVTMCP